MITINLLKKSSSGRRGIGVGFARILTAGILGLAIAAVGAGIIWRWIEHPRVESIMTAKTATAVVKTEPEKKPVPLPVPVPAAVAEKKPAAVPLPEPEKQPVAPAAAAPQPEPAPEKKQIPAIASVPSLLPEKKAAPEPVLTAAAAPRPQEPASRGGDDVQKISNDIAFVKQVLKKLTEAVPDEIGFGALSIDSFSTVTGVGTAATRETVSSLFLNLRREKLNVLGHPDSYIVDNDGKGYSFVFICKPSFGDAPTDLLRKGDNLVPRNRISEVIKAFSKTAARNKLFLQRGLTHAAVKKTGVYVHNVYHLSCSGTYRNFIAFALELDQAGILCTFAAVRLTARSTSTVDINTDVDFITRE
jgi:hypothetical protein